MLATKRIFVNKVPRVLKGKKSRDSLSHFLSLLGLSRSAGPFLNTSSLVDLVRAESGMPGRLIASPRCSVSRLIGGANWCGGKQVVNYSYEQLAFWCEAGVLF